MASPRQILIAQFERAQELGFTPFAASELEFYLYKETYAEAWEKKYEDLSPTIPYILDYHILATTMDEQYLGPIRRGMQGAGIPVEFSKGEAWHGQHEVNFRYADAVTAADRHTIYKNGVKEIAFLNEISATFMAKPSEKDIGSSFTSTRASWAGTARASSSTRRARRPTPSATSSEGCAPTCATSRCSWRPRSTRQALCVRELGADLGLMGPRQPHLRFPRGRPRPVEESRVPDPGRRREPLPGDGGLLAAGLDGIENQTDPGPELKGNAYEAGKAEAFPSSLREAVGNWEKSPSPRKPSARPCTSTTSTTAVSSRACSTRS